MVIQLIKKSNIKFLIFIFISFIITVLLFAFSGRFLVINEHPQKSEVIIVLGGDSGRIEKGVELFKDGYASYIMVSDGGSRNHPSTEQADKMIKKAIELGVPKNAIIPEIRSQSTYGNAVYSFELIKKYNFRSALVVSSDYHMLRTKLTFEKVYSNSGIRLTYCAASSTYYSYFILKNSQSIQFTVSEYLKLIGYIIHYRV
jgi:uncharacterized SAM-binding protein YcdF (DUF218 family)